MDTIKCKGCGNEYIPRHSKDHRCADCYAKLGKRSKRKGNANELRFSHYLNEQFKKYGFGYIAKRTPRSGGIQEFEPADIMFRHVPNVSIFSQVHFENKNSAQWDIQGWMEYAVQKEKDTGRSRTPILIIRKPNEHSEYAVLRMEDLVRILIDLDAYKTKK
jgi:hypothetical protein